MAKPKPLLTPWTNMIRRYQAVLAASQATPFKGPGTCVASALGCSVMDGVDFIKDIVGHEVTIRGREAVVARCKELLIEWRDM